MRIFATVFLLAACTVVSAQQTVIIPAVSDNTPGVYNSVWATEVQIIKKNPHDSMTVRRLWVCTPEGGFLEDPATALEWEMSPPNASRRLLTLFGGDLLEGTGSTLGAVALEIEGGEAIVNARVADVSRGAWVGVIPFGQGQRIPTSLDPLNGPSHIPWLGGCLNHPCSQSPPYSWDYFRNNIGFVNPNSEPLEIVGLVIPFSYTTVDRPVEIWDNINGSETFSRVIPPFGWAQFSWTATQDYEFSAAGIPIIAYAGFVISLTPDKERPYFAYASTVFSPDPESGVPLFNDPMFIPAENGFIAPYSLEP